jgi:hypothetical protein
VAVLFLVSDRAEIDRRRRLLAPGEFVEVWEALDAPDVTWLGDPELRRIAYQREAATRPPGLYWLGETAKTALDRSGPPLPWLLGIPEAQVPVYYGPSLRETESLPPEETLKARVLSTRGIAVTWATFDATGARIDHRPADPLDPVFFLRRPRARVVHAWRLFRSRADAALYASQVLAGDEEAARWAASIPASDFDDLVRRFAVKPGPSAH